MLVSKARAAAFDVLLRIETTDAYASELMHSSGLSKLSASDHGLATELVMGVLRWRRVLDEAIAEHSSQPLTKLDIEVLIALRLGAYQCLFLDRIPARASINESVELVKRARKTSAAGFANAVLRKLSQAKPDLLKLPVCSSHPAWLVERWHKIYGATAAQRICEYDQKPPATGVRVCDSALLAELRKDAIALEASDFLAKSFRVISGDITRTAALRERRLTIQDEASQLVALLVAGGNSILDCCAAPGGKTRVIAEASADSEIIALELHPHRARLLKKLVPQQNVKIIAADARAMPLNKSFDGVLVDAPCSGTGTLARNPEIKWRLQPADLERLQIYQIQILASAMKQVAPGGRVVYSTCSLEPEENERVVEEVLKLDRSFSVMSCHDELEKLRDSGELAWKDLQSLLNGPFLRTIPGVHPCDGFFAAILVKH
ncbi:MAG TPA: 16S rRNA (cytosine(967)-C(5))-methyltransferase RsmB [Terriglobales bacterium]|nr:16S rRNA (cytosine(967)-C(5))-methyltransferase RsmB [Terriglobales bacterium]